MDYQKRVKTIQKTLRKKGVDALLVTQPDNRRYLSGYHDGDNGIGETSGVLVIPVNGMVHLLTDFRYQLQAEQEVPWAKVEIYTHGILPHLKKLLPKLGIKTLAFETDYVLHSFAKSLGKTLGDVKIKITPTKDLIEKMRVIKDEDEIECLRRSVKLNEEVFGEIYKNLKPGITEIELAVRIESLMRQKGAEKPSFGSIIASSKNSAFPHAVPTTAKIKKNQPLTVDMGLVLDGYCSDMTRTFVPGKADKKYKKIHRIVRKAQVAGIKAVRAGVTGREVDAISRKVITDAGYGKYFGHGLGHGVGLAVHESPRLSRFNNKKLKAGMIVTVEPGIYIPGWGGIRLENMIVVREGGCEDLNKDTTFLDI